MKNTTGFIFILIAVGLYYMVISPQYAKYQAKKAEAAQYTEVLENINDLTERRDDLLVKYQAMPKVELDRLEKILPDTIDSVRLAMDLDSIASLYGISIKTVKVNQEKVDSSATVIETSSGKPYNKVSVEFSFVSSYVNFRRFMHDIEQSLRITDVRTVSFTANAESGLNEYRISIDTYWLK